MMEQRLLAAVILRAVRDAQGDDPILAAEARRWLEATGSDLADLLDISPERVTAWVGQLPALPYEQLPLFEW